MSGVGKVPGACRRIVCVPLKPLVITIFSFSNSFGGASGSLVMFSQSCSLNLMKSISSFTGYIFNPLNVKVIQSSPCAMIAVKLLMSISVVLKNCICQSFIPEPVALRKAIINVFPWLVCALKSP